MNSLGRRVSRLRQQFAPAPDYLQNPRDRLRLIVRAMDHDLSLATYVDSDVLRERNSDGGCGPQKLRPELKSQNRNVA
jgi:hypothetical protein